MFELPLEDDPIAREKLLRARAEIAEIIERYDLAAVVVMHSAPNSTEVMVELSPSYSVIKIDLHGEARIRSVLADYNGDVAAQRYDLTATANMAGAMFEAMAHNAMVTGALSQRLDAETGATHTRFEPVQKH